MSSNTRGCNHVQLDPHISMYKSKFATKARAHKDGQRRQRNCRRDCRDSRTSYPRRNAHRCARRRVSTGPVTTRWYTPVRPHGPPVGTNRTVCKKLSQLKEVNSTSVERTTLGLPLSRCGAAVHASLAPTQPPPPAGLASSPACIESLYLGWSSESPDQFYKVFL